jgi:4-hydroxybenzoate polyprenyltransferase
MLNTLKAYIDLTRAHFFLAWPILFCSGLVLAFENYGGFSWGLVLKTVLISLFGFEAGLVLNDYVDRDLDKKALKPGDSFNRYWRLFGRRPVAEGLISPGSAFSLFLLLFAVTSVLVLTLPFPNSLYVFAIMLYSFGIEYFYQVKKKRPEIPDSPASGEDGPGTFSGGGIPLLWAARYDCACLPGIFLPLDYGPPCCKRPYRCEK